MKAQEEERQTPRSATVTVSLAPRFAISDPGHSRSSNPVGPGPAEAIVQQRPQFQTWYWLAKDPRHWRIDAGGNETEKIER